MHEHMFTLVSKELTEGLRSHRILIWTILCGFFGILSPLSAYYMPEVLALIGSTQNILLSLGKVTYHDAVSQYVKNFTQIGSIIMIFLTMGSIAGEKSDGSLQFLMVRPVSLHAILFAKTIALACMIIPGIIVATIFASLYTRYLFPGFPVVSFMRSNLLLMLYLLVVGVVTLSISAMVQKPMTSGLGSLGVWLVFSVLGSLGRDGRFSYTRLGPQMIHLMEGFPLSWVPVISSVLLILASLTVALVVFKRWEPEN